MNGPVEWFGAIGAIVASGLLAGDLGRKVTGWAFVLFMAVALAWIVSGILSQTWPLVMQNGILLIIDAFGAWQFLLDPHKRRVIEKQEQLAEVAEAEVEAEEGDSSLPMSG